MGDAGSRDGALAVSGPGRRVVLLGASNLARNLPTVLETARRMWGSPVDVLAALGHGRSYGRESCVLVRSLPGILTCRLWDDFSQRPPAPTAALVTDIGNDLLYGALPDQIADWVERCLQRVAAVAAQVVITELPLESLSRVGRSRFLFMRTMLFPRSRLTFEEALRRADELNQRVRALAQRFQAELVTPGRHWYGLDPIHIRRRFQKEAWQHVLDCWQRPSTLPDGPLTSRDRWKVWWLRPYRRRMFGIEQRRDQPAAILHDGTLVSLY